MEFTTLGFWHLSVSLLLRLTCLLMLLVIFLFMFLFSLAEEERDKIPERTLDEDFMNMMMPSDELYSLDRLILLLHLSPTDSIKDEHRVHLSTL